MKNQILERNPAARLRLLHRTGEIINPLMRWFLLAMILANLAGNMYRLMLPLYMNELGASIPQVGMAFSIAALVPLLLQYFGGVLSDNMGRMRAIFLGSIGGILGYAIMVFAGNWQVMTLGIAIESFSQVMIAPSFGPFVAEQSSEKYRGVVFGMATTIFMIVGVVGPPLGGWIAARLGYHMLLILGAIPYGLSFVLRAVLAWWEARHSDKATKKLDRATLLQNLKDTRRALLSSRVVLWLLLTAGVSEILIKLSRELLPLFLEQIAQLNLEQIGTLGSVYAIAYMLAAVPAGRIADRREPRISLATGFLMAALGLVGIVSTRSYAVIAASWFVFGVGSGFLNPIFSTLLSRIIPKKLLGRVFGLYWTIRTAVALPVSWIGGNLWAAFDPRLPFILAAGVGLLFLIVSLRKLTIPAPAPA